MTRRAVDMTRIRRALGRWAEGVLNGTAFAQYTAPAGGSVVTTALRWGDQDYPRAAYPFVVLKFSSPPVAIAHPVSERRTVPGVMRVQVTGTGPGSQRILWVNGVRVSVTGDDDEAIRDALVLALPNTLEPITVAAVDADSLDITAANMGALQSVRGVPSSAFVLTPSDESEVSYRVDRRRAVLSVNVHSKDVAGDDSAGSMTQDLITSLRERAVLSYLTQHGIGVLTIGSPRDLSGLEHVEMEHREQFDVALRIESRTVHPLVPLEVVEVTDETIDEVLFTIDTTP